MATADDGLRRRAIAVAITSELERQAGGGAMRVDVDALAEAIDNALGPQQPTDEGKRPEELNATNDD